MDKTQPEVAGRKAWSIGEFCAIHGISRAAFYLLDKEGKAPRTMKVLSRRLISEEAAAAWRAERTAA
jgi:hypothetical protein